MARYRAAIRSSISSAGRRRIGLSAIRASNRLLLAEGPKGSIATFPPPHTFFFTREVDVNLGYVFYRNDGGGTYSIGVTMPEAESDTFPSYEQNYALYNAPPGTWQKMQMFFYVSPEAGEATRQAALAFTHDDVFKAVPGYKTFVNHFHLRVTDRMRVGGFDTPLQDLIAMKAIGLNVIGLSDFHADSLAANDHGPLRFRDQKDYAEASRRLSDKDFLVVPWEEPSVAFGGHYNIMWPKNVYWSKPGSVGGGRGAGGAAPTPLPFEENDSTYGKVYHTGNADKVQQLLDAEGGYWYHAHPRTKSTAGFPDATWGTKYLQNDRYLGVAFKPGMGQDNSEPTMCAWRCFDAVDTMNNMYAGMGIRPKFVIADIDTYRKSPEDDTYANFPVNYLKLDTVPGPDQDWSPVLKAMREGNFFVSTGEILIKNYAVSGTGTQRTHHGRRRVDVPDGVHGDRHGRRKDSDEESDLCDRHAGVWNEEALDSVRCRRQEVGAVLDVGRRRQRRVRAAAVAVGDRDDELSEKRRTKKENRDEDE